MLTLQLSSSGGRLIISSDGVWDALSPEVAVDCCRGMPPDVAASQIVKVIPVLWHFHLLFSSLYLFTYNFVPFICFQEAVGVKGLRDDTTCIVIDIQPPEKPIPPLVPPKKHSKGVFKSMFKKKPSESSSHTEKEYNEPDVVEELFEEGSASLSQRFVPYCS